MSAYLRTASGERVLLDTAKCKLVLEETEYDLTGATLDFYDAEILVVEGTMGTDRTPCRVQRITDPFTGLKVELPVLEPAAQQIAAAFGRRRRWWRRSRQQ